jgi:hypothetical protein
MTAPHPLPASARRSSRSGPSSAIGGGRCTSVRRGRARMWDYLPTTTRLSQACRSTLRHLSPRPPCPARSAGAGSFVSATRCDFKPRLNRPTRLGFHFGTSRSMTQLTPARLSRGGVFHTLSTLTSGHPQRPRSPSDRSQRSCVRRWMVVRAAYVERPGLSVQ